MTTGLLKLTPLQFEWKKSKNQAIGFSAEEVQQHLPACVREDAGGTKMIDESALVTVLTQVCLQSFIQ